MKTEKAETHTVTGSGIFMNSSLRLKSNKKPGRKSSLLKKSVLLDNALKTTQKTKLTLAKGVNWATFDTNSLVAPDVLCQSHTSGNFSVMCAKTELGIALECVRTAGF